jgi:tetratricopeptide (TPR) repeat protein
MNKRNSLQSNLKVYIALGVCLFISIIGHTQTAESYVESGQTKMRSRDISGSLTDFSTAISLNPKFELAYVSRGLCRMAQGNWAKAIPDCDKAIELNPNQAVAYFVRGCAKANTGKKGCTDLHKSLDLGYPQAQMAIDRYCN